MRGYLYPSRGRPYGLCGESNIALGLYLSHLVSYGLLLYSMERPILYVYLTISPKGRIYKPTNNNLRTSSNSRNKNVDTTLWYKNGNPSRQFGNKRTMNVAGARENVGSPVVQQSRIQCFNCKEFTEKGVSLQAEEYDWLANTDEEIDEQELEAHYSYMAKIQE
nr:hypothetical protein [Tanacetum cinerariifolium]